MTSHYFVKLKDPFFLSRIVGLLEKTMDTLTVYPICATLFKNKWRCAMGKTSTIRARIEPDLKNKAEHIFRQLGLTTTQAITLFYKQVELRKGLPFDVAISNEITRQTLDDTDAGRNLIVCDDADDMFKKLGI